LKSFALKSWRPPPPLAAKSIVTSPP
jgi:hypothetical protein